MLKQNKLWPVLHKTNIKVNYANSQRTVYITYTICLESRHREMHSLVVQLMRNTLVDKYLTL